MDILAKTMIAIGGGIASYLFGGWSVMLSILLTFVIIDYVTGLVAAFKEGKLKSDVGLWGIAKKVMIFGIVTVAHLIDTALGEAHLFRDTAIFFYLSNELLSLIENAGRIGAPIPPALQKAVEVLKSKSGDQNLNDWREGLHSSDRRSQNLTGKTDESQVQIGSGDLPDSLHSNNAAQTTAQTTVKTLHQEESATHDRP